MSRVLAIGNNNAGSRTAIEAINNLKNHGHEVVVLKNEKDMNTDHVKNLPLLAAISMFEQLGRNDYDNRSGLDNQEQEIYAYGNISLIKEYNLIIAKKSKLSKRKRDIVVSRLAYELKNNNIYDYEKEQVVGYSCS